MSAYIASKRLLSSVLEGLSDPAILVEPSRRILASNHAFRDRFNAGDDPRGAFCFEMTHDRCSPCEAEGRVRCPLQSRGVERFFHQHAPCLGDCYEEVFVHPVEGSPGKVAAYLLVAHPQMWSGQLVGQSRAFNRMMSSVHRAAADTSPVLLWGETGSGKTCIARALHDLGERSRRPFIVASCGASDERVLAAELFGTESSEQEVEHRPLGLLDAAKAGTMMLQGVGDVPRSLVPKIAKVIREGTFTRVGGEEEIATKVRWIFSAQRATGLEVVKGLPDLVRIGVPPLRRRIEDLEPLVMRLIERFGEGKIRSVSPQVLKLLRQHPFPGNVRELEGMVERACMLADGGSLLPEHFPEVNGTIH